MIEGDPLVPAVIEQKLQQGFGPTMGRWLEKSEVLGPVYRLYFGTVYNPQAFLEQQVLSLVQALEVYHRRIMTTPELPAEEHERRKERPPRPAPTIVTGVAIMLLSKSFQSVIGTLFQQSLWNNVLTMSSSC